MLRIVNPFRRRTAKPAAHNNETWPSLTLTEIGTSALG